MVDVIIRKHQIMQLGMFWCFLFLFHFDGINTPKRRGFLYSVPSFSLMYVEWLAILILEDEWLTLCIGILTCKF